MARNISWESYPIRKTMDGWDERYSSVDEFKLQLADDFLSSQRCGIWGGLVFGTEYSSGDHDHESSNVSRRSITEKITHVLQKTASKMSYFAYHSLVQFWAVEELEGRCCLATSHQPFAVGCLAKGLCWLRKKCMQHYYYYIADEDKLGPPARVYRNGNPESSPDILLYSTKEFSLRDFVVGCDLNSYLALPIFDMHHNQCLGVLEFIYTGSLRYRLVEWSTVIYDALQEVGLRLTHEYKSHSKNMQSQPQPLPEIREMLNLAIKSVPQLHLAQVWLPCNQCANNNSCMERKISVGGIDVDIFLDWTTDFVDACGFHNIQNGQAIVGLALSSTNKSYFCKNLSEFSITDYPMKHYAQLERFSSCFAICPRNKHNGNDICVFEFFLQPQSRDTASIHSICHLLLKIMEKELKSFEISTEQYFGTEQQPLEKHMLAIPIKIYEETFSVLEFKEFFQKIDLSCSHKRREKNYGWICCSKKGEESSENRGNDSSMPQINLGTEAIKLVLSVILSICTWDDDFLIQFWVQKYVDNKLFLSTSEQPFALGNLRKGLCWYRKQCVQHLYYISDGAKEEELGSPGRVFVNCRPESSQDPRLYSRREFPLRDDLVSSGARTYLALPLFGLHAKQCVGVLEFVGLIYLNWNQIYEKLEVFSSALKKYNLRCTNISYHFRFPIDEGEKQALSKIEEMLMLVVENPQLQTVSVWIPCSRQCAHNKIETSCMERAKILCTNSESFDWRIQEFIKACEFHRPQITNGVIGKVIESESKLYFCEDLCSSSICQQPLAHYVQAARLDICFAICLKSSYTGNSPYVIEFFLSPHSTKDEYSRTLIFLLSIMKQMLKSFKVASGQLLAEELIYEVHFEDASQNITGFSTANHLTVEKSGGQCIIPLGFENVKYSENQLHFSGIDDAIDIDREQERNIADDAIDIDQEQERNIVDDAIDIIREHERNIADAIDVEDDAQNSTDHVNFEEVNERNRSSTSFNVSPKQIKSQFGKSRKDAAKNLGVSISTFKRKCRDFGIKRWPSKMNINNPSLFQKKFAIKGVENTDYKASAPSVFDLKTSDYPIKTNFSSHPIEKTTELASICQVADVVIKAKFKGDILKFEFHVSRGLGELMEEVGRRLKLKTGEFRLKYVDDDDDEILLTCDDNLNFYLKSLKSLGKTTVQVLVHLISE